MNREPMPWLVRVLRAVVYAACAGVFAWPLAQPLTALSCALGAAIGSLLGVKLASTSLRSPWLPVLGLVAAGLLHGLVGLLGDSGSAGVSFGGARFLVLIDSLEFGLVAFVFSATLSALSARLRWLAFVEVAIGGAIVSQLVADHRNGAINRPFELADPILLADGDPMLLFYALGGVAALLLALILIVEKRVLRLAAHMLVLLMLIGAAGLLVTSGVVPRPAPEDQGLGLGKKDKGGKKEQNERSGRGQARRGKPNNNDLEFRDDQESQGRQTPVAVVLLHDDYSPPGGIYYFRQTAFSQFNGHKLVATTRDGLDRDLAQTFPVEKFQVPEAPEAGVDRASLETTVALMSDHPQPFGLEAPVSFTPALNPNPDRFRRVYIVESVSLTADLMSLVGHEPGNPKWSAEDFSAYLQIPDDKRYHELADEIMKDIPAEVAEDPMVKAYAVTQWLGKQGIYSLRSKHAGATDPTAHFLFGDKTGYCVHFAHAATYLLRALGVPTRVAAGYAVDESERQGGSAILIATGSAHAWPEVYLKGVGWVVADVHPEQTLDPPPEPADADLQRLLGQLARGQKPLPPDGGPPPFEWLKKLKEFARVAVTALGYAALGFLIALYLIKLWRFVSPRFAPAKQISRVAYRAELDRLAEVGIARRRGESREAFAMRVMAELPSLSPLTALHVGARFGSRRSAEASRDDVLRLAKNLRAERKTRFGWARRLFGALLPWTWLRAR